VAAGLACWAGLLAATIQTKTTQPKTAAASRKHKTHRAHVTHTAHVVKKAPAHSTHPASSTSSKWHPGQTAPTPDRYKEIQEALAKKGYLHSEANGVWNQESADALRRFQQDQNLQASGKLDSLSIIALGLGPKY
jgi:hypothetical protein